MLVPCGELLSDGRHLLHEERRLLRPQLMHVGKQPEVDLHLHRLAAHLSDEPSLVAARRVCAVDRHHHVHQNPAQILRDGIARVARQLASHLRELKRHRVAVTINGQILAIEDLIEIKGDF